MRGERKLIGVTAGFTVAILTAAGCSSSGGATPHTGGSGGSVTSGPALSPTTPVAASSTSSSAAVPTGKQLAALFGAATPPVGYALLAGGVTDSGDALLAHPGAYLALTDCKHLPGASNHDLTADYESSEAEIALAKDTGRVSVLVAAYAHGDADRQWSELTSLLTKCETFDTSVQALRGGSMVPTTITMKTTVTPVAALGDRALDVKLGNPGAGISGRHFLLVRSGDRIISMWQGPTFDLQPFAQAYTRALTS